VACRGEASLRTLPVLRMTTGAVLLYVKNYQNKGRTWRITKSPRKVNGYDFPGPSVLPSSTKISSYYSERKIACLPL
jgi:hypothetical protein